MSRQPDAYRGAILFLDGEGYLDARAFVPAHVVDAHLAGGWRIVHWTPNDDGHAIVRPHGAVVERER